MKRLIQLAFFVFISSMAFAQSETYTKDVSMSLGNQPAFVLDMNEINEKDAANYWQDYMKEYGKIKKNRKADEYYSEGIDIPLVSDKKLDLYSKVEDLKGNSRLYVWIDNGGAFVSESTDPGTTNTAKTFLNDFAVYAEKLHVEELIKMEENQLKDLEKDLKGLEKDKEKFEKTIEKAKETIAENEKSIEENIVSQENKVTEIDDQKNYIIKIKERLAQVGKKKTKM